MSGWHVTIDSNLKGRVHDDTVPVNHLGTAVEIALHGAGIDRECSGSYQVTATYEHEVADELAYDRDPW